MQAVLALALDWNDQTLEAITAARTATLNADVISTGATPTEVWIYWGPADGGMTEVARKRLQVIAELAELVLERASEEHVAFALAPRLNAVGRLADANVAVELLTLGEVSNSVRQFPRGNTPPDVQLK